MRETRTSGLMSGGVETGPPKETAPPLDSTRFLLNTTEETDCFWPNPITLCYLTNYIHSAETGEIFGLAGFVHYFYPSGRSNFALDFR